MIVEGERWVLTAVVFVCRCCKQRYMPNLKKMSVKSCSSRSQLFSVSFSEYFSYVTNFKDTIKLIEKYKVNITTSFTVAYQTSGFGNSIISKIYGKFGIRIIFLFSFFLAYIYLFINLFIYCIFLPLFTIKSDLYKGTGLCNCK